MHGYFGKNIPSINNNARRGKVLFLVIISPINSIPKNTSQTKKVNQLISPNSIITGIAKSILAGPVDMGTGKLEDLR